jgi:hypothetical protein
MGYSMADYTVELSDKQAMTEKVCIISDSQTLFPLSFTNFYGNARPYVSSFKVIKGFKLNVVLEVCNENCQVSYSSALNYMLYRSAT